MSETLAAQSPGAVGVFDPNTNSVGLPFDLEQIVPVLGKFKPRHWQKSLQVYHEWCHFYQFATTSYGQIFQMLSRAQTMMLAFALQVYGDADYRLSLPLMHHADSEDFRRAFDGNDATRGFLRIVSLLEQQRRNIFGFFDPTELFADFGSESTDERNAVREFLHETFALPKLAITDSPHHIPVAATFGYRIHHLLESHAHVLSCLWMAQRAERYGSPKGVSRKILDYLNQHASGPYGKLLVLLHDLPVEEKLQPFTFCALCDMALNPPGLHSWEGGTLVMVPDVVWDPTTRALELLTGTIEGKIPPPRPEEAEYPSWENDYLAAVRESLGIAGNAISIGSDVTPRVNAVIEKLGQYTDAEYPIEAIGLGWLDSMGTYRTAAELREELPILLGGMNIEEFEILVKAFAGPNAIYYGTPPKVFSRLCCGLVHLGMIEGEELTKTSDALTHADIGINAAFRKLLLLSREEAESVQDTPPFGNATLSLSDTLKLFDLDIDDFD